MEWSWEVEGRQVETFQCVSCEVKVIPPVPPWVWQRLEKIRRWPNYLVGLFISHSLFGMTLEKHKGGFWMRQFGKLKATLNCYTLAGFNLWPKIVIFGATAKDWSCLQEHTVSCVENPHQTSFKWLVYFIFSRLCLLLCAWARINYTIRSVPWPGCAVWTQQSVMSDECAREHCLVQHWRYKAGENNVY